MGGARSQDITTPGRRSRRPGGVDGPGVGGRTSLARGAGREPRVVHRAHRGRGRRAARPGGRKVTQTSDELAAAVARHGWYHTIELAPGVVTAGMFDHRSAVDRYLLPESLTGLRCLDVGTMDGFWALR